MAFSNQFNYNRYRMGKVETIYTCSKCDTQAPKWSGQCKECGAWGTLEQSNIGTAPVATKQKKEALEKVSAAKPKAFIKISAKDVQRIRSGVGEFDRVLGGGIVSGSLVLLGGDPGVGKSTLVAQIASGIQGEVLYVSGEESAQQIKMRLDRMKLNQEAIQYLGEEHVEVISKTIIERKPALAIIDSIQTVASSSVDSEPGSINQIKASTVRFLDAAKSTGVPIIIIGHVTKGGELGGPKTLEHIVDAVLYLEGDKNHDLRILRGVKNRFGSTNEIGVFQMKQGGLAEVKNPSESFVKERSEAAGSCITAVVEGNRIFLVEVQALVNKTSFGYPQRKSSGYDLNRLNMLLAVLMRRAQLPFDTQDIYVNVVGGVKFQEPSMDAAVAMALVSALYDQPLRNNLVAWGEVGLGGEIRSAQRSQDRAKEAARFGLNKIISSKEAKNIQAAIQTAGIQQ